MKQKLPDFNETLYENAHMQLFSNNYELLKKLYLEKYNDIVNNNINQIIFYEKNYYGNKLIKTNEDHLLENYTYKLNNINLMFLDKFNWSKLLLKYSFNSHIDIGMELIDLLDDNKVLEHKILLEIFKNVGTISPLYPPLLPYISFTEEEYNDYCIICSDFFVRTNFLKKVCHNLNDEINEYIINNSDKKIISKLIDFQSKANLLGESPYNYVKTNEEFENAPYSEIIYYTKKEVDDFISTESLINARELLSNIITKNISINDTYPIISYECILKVLLKLMNEKTLNNFIEIYQDIRNHYINNEGYDCQNLDKLLYDILNDDLNRHK